MNSRLLSLIDRGYSKEEIFNELKEKYEKEGHL